MESANGWNDERIIAYLQSQGAPISDFYLIGNGYGSYLDEEMAALCQTRIGYCLDDDEDRAAAVVAYLRRIGAKTIDTDNSKQCHDRSPPPLVVWIADAVRRGDDRMLDGVADQHSSGQKT